MRLPLALLCLLIAPLTLRAQSPYLVKDINTITANNPQASSPGNFFRYGSRVFFAATTFSGKELWATDGTQAGTVQVADIFSASSSNPSQFVVVNGKLLFNARDSHGEELWSTDGTSAGTRLLADIFNGSRGSIPGDRIVYHGQMIFAADDGIDGNELWITDGTPAGTRFFKDLDPGTNGSDPHSFVLFNDTVYFVASGGLWKTDGTGEGTVRVKSLDQVTNLLVAGPRMFFSGYTAQEGSGPWVSDGTEEGTRLIATVASATEAASGIYIGGAAALGDRYLFFAREPQHGSELWISDGTAGGTHPVRDINPGPSDSVTQLSLAVTGDIAIFSANTASEGAELWRTDGTEAGTTLVRDILPGSSPGGIPFGSGPGSFVAVGDRVFFIASNGVERTLWATDGTVDGTHQVKTSSRLVLSASFPALTNIDGILYFAGANTLYGLEPWKSDGTDAGTSMIANIMPDTTPSSIPANLVAAGDWVYFNAWDGTGTITPGSPQTPSLWRSDGTPEGTLKLTDSPGTVYVPVGRSIFFNKLGSFDLWTSDGTPEGTSIASEFVSRFPSNPSLLFVDGERIFAAVAPDVLWTTTAASKAPALSLPVSGAHGFVDVAGRVMFFAGNGLWTSDGTPAGTYAVVPDLGGRGASIAVLGGYLYFDTSGTGGTKLWKSDGSFDGTTLVKTVLSGTSTLHFVVAGRNLFFIANGQLWITDGTDAGTHALPPRTDGPIAAVGDRVVFPSNDDANGMELWVSDGSVEGTHLLRDIFPGTLSSTPTELTSVDGVVYFRATDDVHGAEPWVTDGTPEGTKLVTDLEPGLSGSGPRSYVRAGDRLFFAAFTSATGNELWALALSSQPRLTVNDIRVAEGDSGTTTARFTVTLSAASAQPVTVDYATSDGTALAGSDYEAASGTLTFAPGETSKNIDILVRGDLIAENNETFAVTLRNAAGAALARSSAFAIIEDDDGTADLSLALDFSLWDLLDVIVNATNNGPRTATNVKILHTATPADVSSCQACAAVLSQLQPGATSRAFDNRWFSDQQYLTATAVIHERDPQPSNNSIGWVTNLYLAMDALFLTPGSQANVWLGPNSNFTTLSIASSNPAVISVPSSVTLIQGKPVSFIARGVSVGTATIRVYSPSSTFGTLTVDVVPSGTKPRWPGAITAYPENGGTSFDRQLGFSIYTTGTAPYSGETATGVVTVTDNGRELGRVTLTPGFGLKRVLAYLPYLGANAIRIDYPGDANFLPMSVTSNVTVDTGRATIGGGVERNGTTAKVHLTVTGSPEGTPTGTIRISEPGVIPASDLVLTPASPGVAQADVTLTNVSAAQHTFVIAYAGDTHYGPSTQSVRLTEAHRRAVLH